MSLRDLILGRKRRIREGLEAPAADGAGLSRAAIEPEPAPPPVEVAPEVALETETPGRKTGPEAGKGRKVVLRRVRALTVPGALVSDARRQAVLDRLFIVLDPNEVLITGGDRVARLIVANQRLMVAQFSQGDAPDMTFDFRPGLQAEDLALACVRALADFCAAPVDLVIGEQPVAGVFAGFGGVPIEAISFDEAEFSAALQAILSHPDHDHAGLGEAPADPVEVPPKLAPLVLSSPEPEFLAPVLPARTVEAPAAPFSAEVPDLRSSKLAAMAFLAGCRSFADEVQLQSRAGRDGLTGVRATDSFGDLPAAEALETWRQAVSPVLGSRLVAVLIPADRSEPMVALALDDRDSVLFSFGKQALGSVSTQASAAVSGD